MLRTDGQSRAGDDERPDSPSSQANNPTGMQPGLPLGLNFGILAESRQIWLKLKQLGL